MKTACYILFHTIDDREESMKIIGVFESEELAESTIQELSGKPGFIDHPDGFLIDKYTLNGIHWSEGFGID